MKLLAEDLPGGWDLLEADRKKIFSEQLKSEIAEGHDLFGQNLVVITTCIGCDETLVFSETSSRFSIVHLTWGKKQTPPWPTSKLFESEMPVAEMIEHAKHTSADD